VTYLCQIMLEELRRRNYAESTIHAYIRTVEHFSRHFHRPPDQLGPDHIRQYQAALFTRWKLAPNTVTQRLASLTVFLCPGVAHSSSTNISYRLRSRAPSPPGCGYCSAMTGSPAASGLSEDRNTRLAAAGYVQEGAGYIAGFFGE
jgi:hypothetical protein